MDEYANRKIKLPLNPVSRRMLKSFSLENKATILNGKRSYSTSSLLSEIPFSLSDSKRRFK